MFWSTTINLAQSSEWHEHEIVELIFCRFGSGLLLLGHLEVELTSQRAIMVAPSARHRFYFRAGESAELKIVCLTQADAAINLSALQNVVLEQVKVRGAAWIDYSEQDAWLWDLAGRIPDTLGVEVLSESAMTWSLIGLLVHSLARRAGILEDITDRHSGKMKDVCSWIDANLTQSENLDAIASRFGMSRSLLTREFRKFTGTSIVNYVNSRRLQNAANALMTPGKSILEVSLECGFASLANFYKQFKGLYGVTPAEFRNQLAGSLGVKTG